MISDFFRGIIEIIKCIKTPVKLVGLPISIVLSCIAYFNTDGLSKYLSIIPIIAYVIYKGNMGKQEKEEIRETKTMQNCNSYVNDYTNNCQSIAKIERITNNSTKETIYFFNE